MNTGTDGGDPSFETPASMNSSEMGDYLTRLVWENFSDFVAEGHADALLGELGLTTDDGVPTDHTAEEVLIFFMWAHTRAVQLAFARTAPPKRVKAALDAFHAAIFEDMVLHGTPRSQIPLFEQRVSVRYEEYHAAADRSDQALGEAAARSLTWASEGDPVRGVAEALALRAVEAADPLRDFLEEVELRP